MLDVQPQDVVREIFRFKMGIYLADVSLVLVIPAALMVGNRKHGGDGCDTRELGLLSEDVVEGRAGHEQEVHHTAFRDPDRFLASVFIRFDVDERFGRVQPQSASSSTSGREAKEGRDATVESHLGVEVELEHVQVVQTERLVVIGVRTGGVFQRERRGVLRNAEYRGGARERDVHAKGSGA